MDMDSHFSNEQICCDHNMPETIHEMAQSLLVIHTYVSSYHNLLKERQLNTDELHHVFSKIKKHIALIESKLNCMRQF